MSAGRGEGRRARRVGGLALGVGLAYAVGALAAWQAFGSGAYPVLFPPSGVTVAAMLLTPRRRWPVIVMAIVVAELSIDGGHDVGPATAAGYALANVVEPLVGASVVRAWWGRAPDLRRRADLAKFFAGAVVAGPLVGAAIGAAAIPSSAALWSTETLRWWAGDALGVLVIAPPLLLWPRRWRLLRQRRWEAAAVSAVAVGLQLTAFRHVVPPSMLMLPVLMWAAVRLGVLGVAVTGAVMSVAMVLTTAAGHVLFPCVGLAAWADGVAITQIYLAFMLSIAFLIAQEVHSRQSAVSEGRAEQRRRVQVEALAALAQRLSADLTPADIGQTAAVTAMETFGAQAVTLGLVNQEGDRLEWVTMAGYAPAVVTEFAGGLALSEPTIATEVVRTGVPLIVRDLADTPARYPITARWITLMGGSSFVAWPLTVNGRTVGLLNLLWRDEQPLDDAQVAYVSAVASMVGQALVRARIYADENARAAVLQEAVLPTEPPPIDGLELGVSYQPADAVHGLGGDWYDVVPLPGGTYLAVGDVVGHGLSSVEDMAQLRTAGRTLALQGLSPGRILAELNGFTRQLTNGKFATMVVAILDPMTGTLTYAYAGHPPALLRRRRDGTALQLDATRGPALGVIAGVSYAEARFATGVGDAVILYSDGLIESRDCAMDAGIERAERIVASWPEEAGLHECCQELVRALSPTPRHDDVCILAVRIRGRERSDP